MLLLFNVSNNEPAKVAFPVSPINLRRVSCFIKCKLIIAFIYLFFCPVRDNMLVELYVTVSIHAVGMKDIYITYRAYGTNPSLFILFYQAMVPTGPTILMLHK